MNVKTSMRIAFENSVVNATPTLLKGLITFALRSNAGVKRVKQGWSVSRA